MFFRDQTGTIGYSPWGLKELDKIEKLTTQNSHSIKIEWLSLHAVIHTKMHFSVYSHESWTSLVVQMVKNLPAMQEAWVRSLGWDDPLKKGMAIHSSILAWKIPWTEKCEGYSPWDRKKSNTTEQLTHTQYQAVISVLVTLTCK